MIIEFFIFLFGLIIGSFLNVLIYRLPLNKSIVTPRSSCINCNETIKFYDNIPLLSYVFLQGKCRSCNEKISIQYPIVEFLTALLTLLLFQKLDFSIEFFLMSIISYLLITLSFIDLKYKAVPDYLLVLILLFSVFHYPISLESLQNGLLFAGAFALLNFLITFYIQNIKSRLKNDESLKDQIALGEGDIPIIASIGAILGVYSGIIAIFLAAILAIIPAIYNLFVKNDTQTPFIPFLASGLLLEYLFNISRIFLP